MIFQQLILEPILQVDDPTRLDATQTFVSPDEGSIIKVEISPDNGVNYFDVTGNDSDDWFLDWAYNSPGTQTIKVRVSTTLSTDLEKDFTLEVVTALEDCLFSFDSDLITKEPEIYCYLKKGRKSFKDVHRCSQRLIMDWLAMQVPVRDCSINTDDGCVPRKLTKKDLYDKEEVRAWSIYQTFMLIFEGLSNQEGDVFSQKMTRYSELMYRARSRSEITVDIDQDGKSDYQENLRTSRLTRRG